MKSTDFSDVVWRKSSRSNGQANCVEIAGVWRKSSRSNHEGACVEVAEAGEVIGVRDSKDRSGPVLAFTAGDWRAFLAAAKAGHHDLS